MALPRTPAVFGRPGIPKEAVGKGRERSVWREGKRKKRNGGEEGKMRGREWEGRGWKGEEAERTGTSFSHFKPCHQCTKYNSPPINFMFPMLLCHTTHCGPALLQVLGTRTCLRLLYRNRGVAADRISADPHTTFARIRELNSSGL